PQPPPQFTLFPYTTLFRSAAKLARIDEKSKHAAKTCAGCGCFALAWNCRVRQNSSTPAGFYTHLSSLSRGRDLAYLEPFAGLEIDRKSTRLNSSHVKISYA